MDSRLIELIRTQIPEPNLSVSENPLVLFLEEMEAAFATLADDLAPPVVPPSVDSVTINEVAPTVGVGNTVQLTVNVVVSGDVPPATTVTWSSSDEAVATVDGDGLVTGVGEGEADITATSTADTDVSDTVTVTVTL